MKNDASAPVIAVIACIVVAIGGWLWQLYQFARIGTLPSWSIIDAIASLFPQWGWLHQPTDWVGLHSVLAWTNAGCGLAFIALAVAITAEH